MHVLAPSLTPQGEILLRMVSCGVVYIHSNPALQTPLNCGHRSFTDKPKQCACVCCTLNTPELWTPDISYCGKKTRMKLVFIIIYLHK